MLISKLAALLSSAFWSFNLTAKVVSESTRSFIGRFLKSNPVQKQSRLLQGFGNPE